MRPLLLALVVAASAASQTSPLDSADRVRLAEAFRQAGAVPDGLGPDGVPFAVLVVAGEREVLVRHPSPSADFARAVAYDSLLESAVYVRERQYPPGLQATFPAVGGVPTVVVGTAAGTGLASTPWVLTVLHERVHQLQMSAPGYHAGVAALDLDGGDETGMWMLDYPYPYADPAVAEAFGAFRDALVGSLAAPDLGAVRGARARLRAAVAPADDRYLAFQLWQEGVARYAEVRAAEAAGPPLPAFAALPDAVPYAVAADTLRARLGRDLARLDLAADGRLAAYPAGAALALVLDAARPGWRRRSLTEPFDLGALLDGR